MLALLTPVRRCCTLAARVLQVKYIFGVKITMGSSTRLQDYLAQYLSQIRNLRWEEFVMGVTCMIILIAFRVSFHS